MPCVDAPLVCAVPCAVALMACVCVTPLADYACFVTLAVVFVLVMCVQCIGQSSRCNGWFPLYLCVCFVAATSGFVLVLQMQRLGSLISGARGQCAHAFASSQTCGGMHFFIIMIVRRISLRDIIVHVSAEERHHTCVGVGVISAGVEDRRLILVGHGLAWRVKRLPCRQLRCPSFQ